MTSELPFPFHIFTNHVGPVFIYIYILLLQCTDSKPAMQFICLQYTTLISNASNLTILLSPCHCFSYLENSWIISFLPLHVNYEKLQSSSLASVVVGVFCSLTESNSSVSAQESVTSWAIFGSGGFYLQRCSFRYSQ